MRYGPQQVEGGNRAVAQYTVQGQKAAQMTDRRTPNWGSVEQGGEDHRLDEPTKDQGMKPPKRAHAMMKKTEAVQGTLRDASDVLPPREGGVQPHPEVAQVGDMGKLSVAKRKGGWGG